VASFDMLQRESGANALGDHRCASFRSYFLDASQVFSIWKVFVFGSVGVTIASTLRYTVVEWMPLLIC